ncbi:MAG TPA: hypothetical protein VGQ72_04000 [Pyrinomonadaceae bacterium]|jgi:hypothetical protein|nr:hypothetical protein [Pyrinomonadaceae bacterium]
MMKRDAATTERLRKLIAQIEALTKNGELRWERQAGSAHRFARWNNNLLILGPAAIEDKHLPRYLFITPFDSPDYIEINSDDKELGPSVVNLFKQVDATTRNEPAVDPFAIDSALLDRLIQQ